MRKKQSVRQVASVQWEAAMFLCFSSLLVSFKPMPPSPWTNWFCFHKIFGDSISFITAMVGFNNHFTWNQDRFFLDWQTGGRFLTSVSWGKQIGGKLYNHTISYMKNIIDSHHLQPKPWKWFHPPPPFVAGLPPSVFRWMDACDVSPPCFCCRFKNSTWSEDGRNFHDPTPRRWPQVERSGNHRMGVLGFFWWVWLKIEKKNYRFGWWVFGGWWWFELSKFWIWCKQKNN